jgi:hypothetical protein
MDSKTLLLIPGIIYGMGLAGLLRAFRPKIYWEIAVMAVLLFLTLIINWFIVSQELTSGLESLGVYTLIMISPLLFTRACMVLTPERDVLDTKAHYLGVIRPLFLILATHTTVNIIIQSLIYEDGFNVFRYVGVPLLLVCAFYKNLWLRIVVMTVMAVMLLYLVYNYNSLTLTSLK